MDIKEIELSKYESWESLMIRELDEIERDINKKHKRKCSEMKKEGVKKQKVIHSTTTLKRKNESKPATKREKRIKKESVNDGKSSAKRKKQGCVTLLKAKQHKKKSNTNYDGDRVI